MQEMRIESTSGCGTAGGTGVKCDPQVLPAVEPGWTEAGLSPKRWAYWALGCAVLFAVMTVPVAIGQNWPGEWAIVQWALRARSECWTAVMQAVTFFGSSAVGLGLSAGCTVALLVQHRRLTREALLPVAAMAGDA